MVIYEIHGFVIACRAWRQNRPCQVLRTLLWAYLLNRNCFDCRFPVTFALLLTIYRSDIIYFIVEQFLS